MAALHQVSAGVEDDACITLYSILARLLTLRPEPALLSHLADAERALPVAPRDVTRAWQRVVFAAVLLGTDAIAREFDRLFSPDEPVVDLNASSYAAGQDFADEHLGVLCGSMHSLACFAIPRQREFFRARIAPWYRAPLLGLKAEPRANFYRHVATLALAFLDAEERTLRPVPHRHPPG